MVKELISEQVGSIGSWLSPVPLRGSHIAFGLECQDLAGSAQDAFSTTRVIVLRAKQKVFHSLLMC